MKYAKLDVQSDVAMHKRLRLGLFFFVFVGFYGCQKDKESNVVPENTRINGQVLRFGTNAPAAPGIMRIAVFEEEEASLNAAAQVRLIQTFESANDGKFSFGLNAMRHPRFKYYAQILTSVERHFDPASFKFYFDAGRTQELNLYHYPHAWLRVKVLPLQPGTGYNLSLAFTNGSDYDIWGTTPFETTELLLGNSIQRVNAVLSRQFSEAVSYSFNKYLPAFDTIEHVIEY